ncbi:PP2C family protein-serine/threonine phosphatase [Streptomyces sp. NPDC047017]|uniref:PP2C family protein-serine/threonine phosphatase n=1 Tax=Streptomyces sp. NPDC047017 TaxID=3155024 RepID=UPI0033E4E876
MHVGRHLASARRRWRSSHALAAIPLGLIVAITLADIRVPQDVHLGPLLVVAPALTTSFAGPRLTGAVGALAVAAQVLIAVLHGGLTTTNHIAQICALTILSVFLVVVCSVRERRALELAQVRSVAEAAQRALLRPLPHRLGHLHIASVYLAAEKEARIGGDLYAVTRAAGSTRVIIADVRGKGLGAIGEAATLLGAFREASQHYAALPDLADALDRSMARHLAQLHETDEQAQEQFVTALLLELPDRSATAQVAHAGHPPPLLIRHGRVTPIDSPHPAPPLGMGELVPGGHDARAFTFAAGDTLLLYTDGVIEARDGDDAFYPLAERVAQWGRCGPEALVQRIRRDLLAHADGTLGDDAAVVAIHRTSGHV